ncbi:transcription termination factor NusA, partial [Candidatus Sumerlaeota bacterium]|nr:transcription termination factor NusA [Candidatus Sumerlaeota bacterium]
VMQRLREAEREKIYAEYKERVGQIVTGIIQRFERRDAMVNIGRAEGVLTLNQQPFGSHYRIGERLKVLITEIEKTQRGPIIRLSRTDPELVVKLFEQEVPEVSDGTVKIVAIAREPGVRTKVAVTSTNPDVDPVGACVGMKGSRVQMIVREFENEKIDIVPHSSNAATLITSALNPAKIVSVKCHPETGEADVLVARGNLSLAIGKKGQNARLAARLTGWRINMRGEEEVEAEAAARELRKRYFDDLLRQITELTDEQRQALAKSQYDSVEQLAAADRAAISALIGDNEQLAGQIISDAQDYLEELAEMTAASGDDQAKPGESSDTPAAPAPVQPIEQGGEDQPE